MELHSLFYPITARPFRADSDYIEYAPCDELKPYIRCFWSTKQMMNTVSEDSTLVIPDGCMDIIFHVNLRENRINSVFCGLDSQPYYAVSSPADRRNGYVFSIRFYGWSAICFSEEAFRGTANKGHIVGKYFEKLEKEIAKYLFEPMDIYSLIRIVEQILRKNLRMNGLNCLMKQGIGNVLTKMGNVKTKDLAKELLISTRHLERLFDEYIGMSPKQFSAVVRHQFLWKDMISQNHFDIHTAVFKYGYTDQSHFVHDFKKYHGLSIGEARNVAFLQDKNR